jgi:hypothetical protein
MGVQSGEGFNLREAHVAFKPSRLNYKFKIVVEVQSGEGFNLQEAHVAFKPSRLNYKFKIVKYCTCT